MDITKKVQLLTNDKTNNGLFKYDFLDLESNLPFTVYSPNESVSYKKLVPYSPCDVKLKLVLTRDKTDKIIWKVKAVD